MNKQQLANKIWESANKMRSKIEANEYKDYILGFIFYKYLSDTELKFLRENDYTDDLLSTVVEDDAETVKWVQQNIGYFISYNDLFSTWIAMGKDFDVSNVRDALSAFSRLISQSHKKVFDGVFDTLQTGLSKLGDSSGSQTKAISGLLQLIKDIPMDGKQDYDVLGFIYEYLISNFAANAGKKAGEFYTPHEVSLLMSEIVANHLKGKTEIKIYDPTSGSGSLLINIGRSVAKYISDSDNIKYYAQELKENTYNLKPIGLFVEKLGYNIEKLNDIYKEISEMFASAGVPDFEKLPDEPTEKAKFASLYKDFNNHLEAARVQGFNWTEYTFTDESTGEVITATPTFDETAFLVLAQRYKELSTPVDPPEPGGGSEDVPYDLVGYLTEIDTGRIDADYMNSRFDKYLKLIHQDDATIEAQEQALSELHKTFAALTQEEQKYANIFLHDVQRGDVTVEDGKSLRDYITDYMSRAKNDQIHQFADIFGIDEEKLRNMIGLNLSESNINEFGRFDELKRTFDKTKAKAFFEKAEGVTLIPPKVNMRMDNLLRDFILKGGFEL